jgi:hypothetical protein
MKMFPHHQFHLLLKSLWLAVSFLGRRRTRHLFGAQLTAVLHLDPCAIAMLEVPSCLFDQTLLDLSRICLMQIHLAAARC